MPTSRTSRAPGRHRLFVALGAFLMIVSATVVGTAIPGGATVAAKPAPRLKDPAATGRALSTEYLTILQRADTKALAKFLDPAFQLQRADGSGADRTQYLADPAKVVSFEIGPTVTARQHGDVLTVRWTVASDQTINGVVQRAGYAPRLSTYRWSGTRWRLISHGNFNLPA